MGAACGKAKPSSSNRKTDDIKKIYLDKHGHNTM